MTTIEKTTFKVGDEVTVPVDMGLMWQARIIGPGTHQFCNTCHCTPTNPEHEFDGSLCCPGPWYAVEVIDPSGNQVKGLHTYAEHEISTGDARQPSPAAEATSHGDNSQADHYHVFAVQDWGGSQEYMRGVDDRLTHADAVQLVADMAEADTAYIGYHNAGGSIERYEAAQRKFGDRFSELISTNMCPGWDGIWIVPCGQECTFHETFDLPPGEWPGKPHWTPSANNTSVVSLAEKREAHSYAAGIAEEHIRKGWYDDHDLKLAGITREEAEACQRERSVAHLVHLYQHRPDILRDALNRIEAQ